MSEIVTAGEFYLRNAGGRKGQLMLLGVVEGQLKPVRRKGADRAVMLKATMQLRVDAVVDATKETRGLRADQILCRGYDMKKMTRVELSDVLLPQSDSRDAMQRWLEGWA